jgi:hypothetical protein
MLPSARFEGKYCSNFHYIKQIYQSNKQAASSRESTAAIFTILNKSIKQVTLGTARQENLQQQPQACSWLFERNLAKHAPVSIRSEDCDHRILIKLFSPEHYPM